MDNYEEFKAKERAIMLPVLSRVRLQLTSEMIGNCV